MIETTTENTDKLEQETITAQLNDVYSQIDSALPSEIAELGFEILRRAD